MDFAEVDFTLMWTVTLAGILIVFSVLLMLVGVFYLFGSIMGGLRKRGESKTQSAAAAPKPAPE
ncbi:MAG: OadG family protein [Clostridiales bacterium]|nr:OadG family protein [Clostridiales bacterium]